jgi:glycosyltransferase involved in cell wall biosynthesis
MRIAQIAPLFEPVPPKTYGGTERIVSLLTEELVARGHEVTLFASGDSTTTARLFATRATALRLDPAPHKSEIAAHLTLLSEVRRQAEVFDVLHFHLSHFQHFPFFDHMPQRTVTTPHGRLDYVDLPNAYARWPFFPMVSISFNQRKPLPQANWIANIHHGLPLDMYVPQPPRADMEEWPYLAFLGRLSRDKGPGRAVAIARRSGMRLKIAAKIGDGDVEYFRRSVKPHIDDDNVVYLGEVDEIGKSELLANAAALLFPIDWPEPFGLVVIEAMAFGTPVIAWREGSMPEVVDDGVTGYLVNSINEAVARIKDLDRLDRGSVRHVYERRFALTRMVDEYEEVYRRLTQAGSKPAVAAA